MHRNVHAVTSRAGMACCNSKAEALVITQPAVGLVQQPAGLHAELLCYIMNQKQALMACLCLFAALLAALHPQPIQAFAADCGHQHSGHREFGHLENLARADHRLCAKPGGLRPERLGRVPRRSLQGWSSMSLMLCVVDSCCVLLYTVDFHARVCPHPWSGRSAPVLCRYSITAGASLKQVHSIEHASALQADIALCHNISTFFGKSQIV